MGVSTRDTYGKVISGNMKVESVRRTFMKKFFLIEFFSILGIVISNSSNVKLM